MLSNSYYRGLYDILTKTLHVVDFFLNITCCRFLLRDFVTLKLFVLVFFFFGFFWLYFSMSRWLLGMNVSPTV